MLKRNYKNIMSQTFSGNLGHTNMKENSRNEMLSKSKIKTNYEEGNMTMDFLGTRSKLKLSRKFKKKNFRKLPGYKQ